MAKETGKIVWLLFVLVIIFGAMGWVISYKGSESKEIVDSQMTAKSELITIAGSEREVPSKKVVVSDKYVGKLDKDGVIVVMGADGQAYNVRNGAVLVDDMVISASEEAYSVYRIDEPAKSVSSN